MRQRGLWLLLPALIAVDWGFNGGTAPLDLGQAPRASTCGACHTTQFEQWSQSNHKRSWHNDLMLVGYAAEPLDFCVHCHTPKPQQKAEILANKDFYRSLDPRSGIPIGSVQRRPEPHASDGVDCAACHWRHGEILAPTRSWAAPHRVRPATEFATGEVCAGCHDFNVPGTVDGHFSLTDVPMQSTTAEWRAWTAGGGDRSCADCHMPNGSHDVLGAHDREFLRQAWKVEVRRDGDVVRFRVESVGVGHNLPTGDLFRHATLEINHGQAWAEIARFGRVFQTTLDGAGVPQKRLVGDTSLIPGQPRSLSVQSADGARWRLRWHDASPTDEIRGLLPLHEITVDLYQGVVPPMENR